MTPVTSLTSHKDGRLVCEAQTPSSHLASALHCARPIKSSRTLRHQCFQSYLTGSEMGDDFPEATQLQRNRDRFQYWFAGFVTISSYTLRPNVSL